MTRTLDVTLEHKETLPTGQVEMMDMDHIDRAVANKIGQVLNRVKVPRLADWVLRPLKEKIMLGEFESPKRFLMALAKSQGLDKDKKKRDQLPAVYVTREPGLAFADVSSSGNKDLINTNQIQNDDEVTVAELDESVLALTYAINFVGWNDADIEPLVALFLMYLRAGHTDKVIYINTVIADTQLTTQGYFSDGPLATATPASLPFEQDKLRSLSVSVTVDVSYLQARYVDEFVVTTDFALDVKRV